MKTYDDSWVLCPFFIKSDCGFIQCEGIENASAVKLMFNSEDGGAIKEEKRLYCDRFCKSKFSECPLFKLIERKYD